jgi:hypothetical protein
MEICSGFRGASKVEVAADLTPLPLQVQYKSDWLLDEPSNEFMIVLGVLRNLQGQRHQIEEQG